MKSLQSLRSALLATSLFISAFAFTSCDKDTVDPVVEENIRGPYDQKGVFIINEGNFGTPSGSISFLSDSANHTVQNEIFKKANDNRPLGDVIQDMAIFEDRAFIVANNSNKLEVVNAYTFKTEGIVNLLQPRYIAVLNKDKAYVTEWVEYGEPGQISVIDLNTYTVTKTIAVGPLPEQLTLVNGKLYAAISGADEVLVINTTTDAIEKTIAVSDSPRELAVDMHASVWVLSSGRTVYNADWSIDYSRTTAGALGIINTSTNTLTNTYTFGSNQSSPANLAVNGAKDKLYFTYQGKTYAQSSHGGGLSNTVLINRSFNGLGVDPETGYIYGSDNNGFTGNGTVLVYTPEGNKVSEFTVGIGPNGFIFN